MASSIQLRCDHPQVSSFVRTWLDGTELNPPGGLVLDVRVSNQLPRMDDQRTAFRQPSVEILSGPPQGDVRISWTLAPALAVIEAGSLRAEVILSPEAAELMEQCVSTFVLIVLIFLLRRAGWHHVHAATAIDPRGCGWLIAGNTYAGKSTTAALLATWGWKVGTDDTAFLTAEGDRVAVVASRLPIALRDGGHDLLRLDGGQPLPLRGKVGYTPEDLGGQWTGRVFPERVLFTKVGSDQTIVQPIPARQTLTELVRWSAWVVLEPELAQQHLDLITRLAGQARGYHVTLGRDLFGNPERLLELVQ